MVVAIPYPPTAQPFNITRMLNYKKVEATPAASLASLNQGTYFYDTVSQHLYVSVENLIDGREIRFGHQHYTSYSAQVEVRAKCGKACTTTSTGMRYLFYLCLCVCACVRACT